MVDVMARELEWNSEEVKDEEARALEFLDSFAGPEPRSDEADTLITDLDDAQLEAVRPEAWEPQLRMSLSWGGLRGMEDTSMRAGA